MMTDVGSFLIKDVVKLPGDCAERESHSSLDLNRRFLLQLADAGTNQTTGFWGIK
jgi:hypothetical protein